MRMRTGVWIALLSRWLAGLPLASMKLTQMFAHAEALRLRSERTPGAATAVPTYEALWRPIVTIYIDTTVLVGLPTFGDTEVRQPDFVDLITETAVWIGEDASVEVPLDLVERIAEYARQQDVYALRGVTPEGVGILVVTHSDEFVHPAFSAHRDATTAKIKTLWREIADVLDAHEINA